jgi:hypothetical protein
MIVQEKKENEDIARIWISIHGQQLEELIFETLLEFGYQKIILNHLNLVTINNCSKWDLFEMLFKINAFFLEII